MTSTSRSASTSLLNVCLVCIGISVIHASWLSRDQFNTLADGIDHTVAACQEDNLFLQCRNRYNKILIKDVFYGRDNLFTCTSKIFNATKLCHVPTPRNIIDKVNIMCNNENKCKVPVTTIFLEKEGHEICYDIRKYLKVRYSCHQNPQLHAICSNGCSTTCWPLCQQSCCNPKPIQPEPVHVMSGTVIIHPGNQQCGGGCPSTCAPLCQPTCCNANAPALQFLPNTVATSCPGTCSGSCLPLCDPTCCMMHSTQVQPHMQAQASCPGSCSNQCAPMCSLSCCAPQPQQVPQPIAQPIAQPVALPSLSCGQDCPTQCAPQCEQSCCKPPSKPKKQSKSPANLPTQSGTCQAGCPSYCAPSCQSSCCNDAMISSPLPSCPGSCPMSCYPTCQQSCCQQGFTNMQMMPQQPPAYAYPPMNTMQSLPMQFPCPQGCSQGMCQPACPPKCCFASRDQVMLASDESTEVQQRRNYQQLLADFRRKQIERYYYG